MFDETKPPSWPDNVREEDGPATGLDLDASEVVELSKNKRIVLRGRYLLSDNEVGKEIKLQGPDFEVSAKIVGVTPNKDGSSEDVEVQIL